MAPSYRSSSTHYFIQLLSIAMIAIVSHTNQCIHSYPNSTINYILNNINIDPFIYYLGNKVSTNECQNSCIDFNYLCDISPSNINCIDNNADGDIFHCEFNNTDCTITLYSSWILLPSNIASNEYIIELQLSISSGVEAGILFKANLPYNSTSDYHDYYYGLDPTDTKNQAVTGWDDYQDYHVIDTTDTSTTITYNTRHNISVHVIGTMFTTYFNGEEMYTNSQKKGELIDESLWTDTYAGMYSYQCDAIFHSFKLKFPNINATDNGDEKICTAFVYDKIDGDCYGYYGDDYAVIEASVTRDAQNKYDSTILYHSTCDSPSQNTTAVPSHNPIVTVPVPSQKEDIITTDQGRLREMSSFHPSSQPSSNPTLAETLMATTTRMNTYEQQHTGTATLYTRSNTTKETNNPTNSYHDSSSLILAIAGSIALFCVCCCCILLLWKAVTQKTWDPRARVQANIEQYAEEIDDESCSKQKDNDVVLQEDVCNAAIQNNNNNVTHETSTTNSNSTVRSSGGKNNTVGGVEGDVEKGENLLNELEGNVENIQSTYTKSYTTGKSEK